MYRSDRYIFRTRYKEHLKHITNNIKGVEYAQHVLRTGHSCVKLDGTIDVYETENKNTFECFGKMSHIQNCGTKFPPER